MDTVNYLLLFKGNSSQGGSELSVRGLSKLEAAQRAMNEAYKKFAAILDIPANPKPVCDRYITRTERSVRLERYGDVFQWEIIKAVPEDGTFTGIESRRLRGMAKYTVFIEEHIVQALSIDAYSFSHAMDSAEAAYKKVLSSARRARPNTRLIMVRNEETGEETEWREF